MQIEMDIVELGAMTPHPQANPPPPAGAAPVGLAITMTPAYTRGVHPSKANWQIAQKFGLEQNMVLEDLPKEKYDLDLGQIDEKNQRTSN
jgi:hypothetical protein